MNQRNYVQIGFPPLPKVSKKLIVINIAVWIVGVLILQDLIFKAPVIFNVFGLVPERIFSSFFLWQPFTYMFIHSGGLFHIFFNMFLLWFLGAELERSWGGKRFLAYYLCGGVGAAFIYVITLYLCSLAGIESAARVFQTPVVGASGAAFALILAYGYYFSERTVYFMLFFPMKASHLTAFLALFEILSLLKGFGSSIAHLCHLGGFVSGGLFILLSKFKGGKGAKNDPFLVNLYKKGKKNRQKFRLVVDRDVEDPEVWH